MSNRISPSRLPLSVIWFCCVIFGARSAIMWKGVEKQAFSNVYTAPDVTLLPSRKKHLDTGAFHLFTHGRPGELWLNERWAGPEDIAAFLEQNTGVMSFRRLHLHGCVFGKGEKGRLAVMYLSRRLHLAVSVVG